MGGGRTPPPPTPSPSHRTLIHYTCHNSSGNKFVASLFVSVGHGAVLKRSPSSQPQCSALPCDAQSATPPHRAGASGAPPLPAVPNLPSPAQVVLQQGRGTVGARSPALRPSHFPHTPVNPRWLISCLLIFPNISILAFLPGKKFPLVESCSTFTAHQRSHRSTFLKVPIAGGFPVLAFTALSLSPAVCLVSSIFCLRSAFGSPVRLSPWTSLGPTPGLGDYALLFVSCAAVFGYVGGGVRL